MTKGERQARAGARNVLISRLVSEVCREVHQETGAPIKLCEAQEEWVRIAFGIFLKNNADYPELDERTRWQQFRDWLKACPLWPGHDGI